MEQESGGGGGVSGFLAKFILIPQRILMALMGFAGIANCYFMRQALSVAITRMVVPISKSNNGSASAVCPKPPGASTSTKNSTVTATYNWSQDEQGWILGTFFIGYLLTHLPAGMLADKFGGKWVLSIGMGVSGSLTLLTPVILQVGGLYAFLASRFLIGTGQGTAFPALSTMLSAWVPLRERGILGSLVMGGGQVGSMLGNALSAFILNSTDEWPFVFYFWGVSSMLWLIFFILLCYNDPESHPFIKEKEKLFLREEIGANKKTGGAPPTPWLAICTSVPMWALLAAQLGHDWGLFIIGSNLPKYMNDVMQFSMKDMGFYSSLPYVLMWATSIVAGFVTDCVITKGYMSILMIRKVNTSIAAFGPAIFMVAASYAGCNKDVVVACFTLCMGTMGPYFSGMKLTALDLSPNYAGTLMAITNGLGSLCGFFTPKSVGWLAPNSTLPEWRNVFWLAFAWLVITAIMYDIWASADVQPWNEGAKPKEEAPPAGKK